MINVAEAFGGILGPGRQVDWRELDEHFADERERLAGETESALGEAGWYDSSAEPYPEPTTEVDAPPRKRPPVITAVRRIWLAKYNPVAAKWYDEATGTSASDVADENLFAWSHPETAVREGNFWLSTLATPNNREGIEILNIGDLVVVQRSDPGPDHANHRGSYGATSVLVGVAIAFAAEEWEEVSTGLRERRVGLLPAAKFDWPIPRTVASSKRRLRGDSFKKMPQRPDGGGRPGFTLSAMVGDHAVNELLAVCGIHPDALAEPDLATLASRLKATAHGNHELWRFRYDHVFRHAIRTKHEQTAVASCRVWADGEDYLFRESAQTTPNAGYDLLFEDQGGKLLQVEVKGYVAPHLRQVHLQRSQACRAREAAKGMPPVWKLYALLQVDTSRPDEKVRSSAQVVALLDSGGIQVR